ncbi:MAG: hypothetical protein MI806_34230 [Minwuiales bacterium]|nr:hypothetical protein [Minwuiales bacterium]
MTWPAAKLGTSANSLFNVTGAVQNLIPNPGSNRSIVLRTCTGVINAGNDATLIASAAAPASRGSGQMVMVLRAGAECQLPFPIILGRNRGLWIFPRLDGTDCDVYATWESIATPI